MTTYIPAEISAVFAAPEPARALFTSHHAAFVPVKSSRGKVIAKG